MKIYEIIPGLYQSAKLHDLTFKEKRELLQRYNIDTVFNLWHTCDDELEDYCEAYYHLSIRDGKNPPPKLAFDLYLNKAEEAYRAGATILVHCYGGRNRAALFNAILIKRILKISGEAAVNIIKEKRPNSFKNEHFEALVKENWL